jgi:uncharacterized protein
MIARPVVCNTSPILALPGIGSLDLLGQLFTQVLIPPGVREELPATEQLPAWFEERPLVGPVASSLMGATLGKGEREAISLAIETNARWIILDDRPARHRARALGLNVIGTLGVLLMAKEERVLESIRPSLDALMNTGFYIAPDLYDQVLTSAGEHQAPDSSAREAD